MQPRPTARLHISAELGLLNLPSRPVTASWWVGKDRAAFRLAVEEEAKRMAGSREEHKSARSYFTWDADSR